MTLDKIDKSILKIYQQLPFPQIVYDLDELNYINNTDFLLHGYCDWLLSYGHTNSYHPHEGMENELEKEFKYTIQILSNQDLLEEKSLVTRYYRLYILVREILEKYS